MSYGHYRNSGIPTIKSYAQALAQWEMTNPIRGRKEELRPLGGRKNTWYSIAKNDKGDIECKLYDCPIITFTTDNNIIIHNLDYISTSTSNFIADVLHYQGIATYIRDFSLVLAINDTTTKQYTEQRLGRGEQLTIIRDAGDKKYHFEVSKPEVTHVVNRKQTNIVRTKYTEFKDYVRQMCLLRGEEVLSASDINNAIGAYYGVNLAGAKHQNMQYQGGQTTAKALKDLKQWIGDTSENRHDGYYKAMIMLVHSFGRYQWNNGVNGQQFTYPQIEKGLDKLIMGFHRDECFSEKLTASGQVKRDAYREYFTGVWAEVHK